MKQVALTVTLLLALLGPANPAAALRAEEGAQSKIQDTPPAPGKTAPVAKDKTTLAPESGPTDQEELQRKLLAIEEKRKADPGNVALTIQAAELLCDLQQFEKAAEYYQKAHIDLDRVRKLLQALDGKQEEAKEMEKELAELRGKLKAAPDDLALMVQTANLLQDLKKYSEAIPWYEKAVGKGPQNLGVRADLAVCYHYDQQDDKAIACLQKVLKDDPNFAPALYNLGVVYFHRGDIRKTKEYWSLLLATKTKDDRVDLARTRQMLEVLDRMIAEEDAAKKK